MATLTTFQQGYHNTEKKPHPNLNLYGFLMENVAKCTLKGWDRGIYVVMYLQCTIK